MKINKKKFENKNFRVLGNILCKNCLSIKKFQFNSSGGPWHGTTLNIFCLCLAHNKNHNHNLIFSQQNR